MTQDRIARFENFSADFDLNAVLSKVFVNIDDATLKRKANGKIAGARTYPIASLAIPENATNAVRNNLINAALPAGTITKIGDRVAIAAGSFGQYFLDDSGDWLPEASLFMRLAVQMGPYSASNTIDTGTTGVSSININPGGTIAVGANTAHRGGILAAALSGPANAGSTAAILDPGSRIWLNAVRLRRSASWSWSEDDRLNQLTTPDGKFLVFGLIQAASTVNDGDSVSANNLQISFVYEDENGVLQTQPVVGPIDYQLPFVIDERNYPLAIAL